MRQEFLELEAKAKWADELQSITFDANPKVVMALIEHLRAVENETLRCSDNLQAYADKYHVGRIGEFLDDAVIHDAERLRHLLVNIHVMTDINPD